MSTPLYWELAIREHYFSIIELYSSHKEMVLKLLFKQSGDRSGANTEKEVWSFN